MPLELPPPSRHLPGGPGSCLSQILFPDPHRSYKFLGSVLLMPNGAPGSRLLVLPLRQRRGEAGENTGKPCFLSLLAVCGPASARAYHLRTLMSKMEMITAPTLRRCYQVQDANDGYLLSLSLPVQLGCVVLQKAQQSATAKPCLALLPARSPPGLCPESAGPHFFTIFSAQP